MQKRVAANYAVSREQKRTVAKNKAKAAGMTRICSKGKKDGKWDGMVNKHSSWFADHWREYVR